MKNTFSLKESIKLLMNKFKTSKNVNHSGIDEKSEAIKETGPEENTPVTVKQYKNLNTIRYSAIQGFLYPHDVSKGYTVKYKPEQFIVTDVRMNEWFVRNGDYFEPGDKICQLKVHRNVSEETFTLSFQEGHGFIKNITVVFYDRIADGDKFFDVDFITDDKELSLILIENDDFEQKQCIRWKRLGGNNEIETRLNGFFLTSTDSGEKVFFTINNINGKDFIVLNFTKDDFDLRRDDKFEILLENKEKITFVFKQNSYQNYKTIDSNYKRIYENKIQLTIYDIEKLAENKILNWKITFANGATVQGINPINNNRAYRTKERFQDFVQLMVKEYQSALNNLSFREPLETKEWSEEFNEKYTESCFVYLMIDTTNNFHKIGISNKPEYREKTLQSEKPSIELLAAKDYPSRQLAESFEKALHSTFKEKHVRGEWFKLDEVDVNQIKDTLK